jgi:hypothetical protein
MSEYLNPVVPNQLQPLLDDHVRDVHERWQEHVLYDVYQMIPKPTVVDLPDNRRARAVVLEPATPDVDTDLTLSLALPYQQAWKPSMFIRAAIAREIVAPNSRMVVLPQNNIRQQFCELDAMELHRLFKGDMRPFYEYETRVLEALKVQGRVALTGYSLGGLTAIGIAGRGSTQFEVAVVNSDEAPNKVRSTRQLAKDFQKSGAWKEQKAAIADAAVPALTEALNTCRLAWDYAKFGIAHTTTTQSKAIMSGMASPSYPELVARAQTQYPNMQLKIGSVLGSQLFDIFQSGYVRGDNVSKYIYSGEGTHLHATGDNVMAHALMFKQALAETV